MAALHVQINTTNDVFEAATKKENGNNFNDSGNVKVLGDLGGRLHKGRGGVVKRGEEKKKVHRCWQNKQHSERLISTEAALVLISRLWVNAPPVGKLSGQHFVLSDVVAAAAADTSKTSPVLWFAAVSIHSVSPLCKADEAVPQLPCRQKTLNWLS